MGYLELKTYSVDKDTFAEIKKRFNGYVFNRTYGSLHLVKLDKKQLKFCKDLVLTELNT